MPVPSSRGVSTAGGSEVSSSPSRWYKQHAAEPPYGAAYAGQQPGPPVTTLGGSAPPAGGPASHRLGAPPYSPAAGHPPPRTPAHAAASGMLSGRGMSPSRTRRGPATELSVSGLLDGHAHLNGPYSLEETGRFRQTQGPGLLTHRNRRWWLLPMSAGARHVCSSVSLLGQWQQDHSGEDRPPPLAYPYVVATRTRDDAAEPPVEAAAAAVPPPPPPPQQTPAPQPQSPAPHPAEPAHRRASDASAHSSARESERDDGGYADEVRRSLQRQLAEARRELAEAKQEAVDAEDRRRATLAGLEGGGDAGRHARELLQCEQREGRVGLLFEESEGFAALLRYHTVPLHRINEAAILAARSERASQEEVAAELGRVMQANETLERERAELTALLEAEREAQRKTALGAEHLSRELESWRNNVKHTLQTEEMQNLAKLQQVQSEASDAQRRADTAEAQAAQMAAKLEIVQERAAQLEEEKRTLMSDVTEQLAEMRRAAATEQRVRDELLAELQEARREARTSSALQNEHLAGRLELLAAAAKVVVSRDVGQDAATMGSYVDSVAAQLAARLAEVEEDAENSSQLIKQLSARNGELESEADRAREQGLSLQEELQSAIAERDAAMERMEKLARDCEERCEARDRTVERLREDLECLRDGRGAARDELEDMKEALRVARVEEGTVQTLTDRITALEAEAGAGAEAAADEHALDKARLMTRIRDLEEKLALHDAAQLHSDVGRALQHGAAPQDPHSDAMDSRNLSPKRFRSLGPPDGASVPTHQPPSHRQPPSHAQPPSHHHQPQQPQSYPPPSYPPPVAVANHEAVARPRDDPSIWSSAQPRPIAEPVAVTDPLFNTRHPQGQSMSDWLHAYRR